MNSKKQITEDILDQKVLEKYRELTVENKKKLGDYLQYLQRKEIENTHLRIEELDKEGFLSKYTLPAIANIVTKEGLSHFVVIFKITKKHVVIGDPGKDLEKIEIDKFYRKFTGVLLILKPNESFIADKVNSKGVFGRYINLLLPQKKLFIYAIIASFLLTALGIISSVFNNVIYDEILPYQQENVLKIMLLVFFVVSITQSLVSFIRQWILMHLSIKIDIPLMLGYFEHIYRLPMKF